MSTGRESRYVRFAKLAYEIAQQAFEPYSHAKSKKVFTQPQLASCVLLMFYLDLSCREPGAGSREPGAGSREMEEWLLASGEVVRW